MNSLILRTATRLLVSLVLLFSIFVTLRGHNEPGGGFIGGLIAASAFALYSIAFGVEALRRAFRFDPRAVAGFGVLVAIISGLLSLPAEAPFLTGLWLTFELVPGEKFALSTPLLFDLGVYLTVIGGVIAIMLALEEEGL
ncbi:MAG: Na+/H+ antiporter subunit B [Alphaproteobacteria bacterium]|nr:Na+/H+ antiporter subunit B [Alphaproteobacteria bacterium]